MPPTVPATLPEARAQTRCDSAERRPGHSGARAQGADPWTPYGRRLVLAAVLPGRVGSDRACGWLHSLAVQSMVRGAESGARGRAASALGRSRRGDGTRPLTPSGSATRRRGTSQAACVRSNWAGPTAAYGCPAAPADPRWASAAPAGMQRPAVPPVPPAGGGCAWLASLGVCAREHAGRLQVDSVPLARSCHLGLGSCGGSGSPAGFAACGRARWAGGLRPSPYGGGLALAAPPAPPVSAAPVAGVPLGGPGAHGGVGMVAIPFSPLGLVAPMVGVPIAAPGEVCTGAGACPHA